MTGDAKQGAHCPVCGHVIADPAEVHRCPACGSYDIAMQRANIVESGSARDLPPNLTDVNADPVAIATVNPYRFLLPSPPKGIPRACWERARRFRYVFVTVELIWIGYLFGPWLLSAVGAPTTLSLSSFLWYPILFLSFVGSIVFPRLLKRAVRRLGGEVQRNNLEHCLECGYPLRGLPAEHRCPECGEAYNIDVVKETWRRYLKAQQ
jgi:predicted RNA-binding Zn-ribbon protein involved in translation (DUF1610 family)